MQYLGDIAIFYVLSMFISQSSYCHRFNEVKNLEQSIDFHDITDNMGHFSIFK